MGFMGSWVALQSIAGIAAQRKSLPFPSVSFPFHCSLSSNHLMLPRTDSQQPKRNIYQTY
jgi:hypothetical protein